MHPHLTLVVAVFVHICTYICEHCSGEEEMGKEFYLCICCISLHNSYTFRFEILWWKFEGLICDRNVKSYQSWPFLRSTACSLKNCISHVWITQYHKIITFRLLYEAYPQSIQPFWVSREPVACPWCNLAASQRRSYCASVNSQSAVRHHWLSWCTVWLAFVRMSERFSLSWQCACPLYISCAGFFWQSVTSSRSVSTPSAQIWLPAASGFSQR
jgi:hypothetical protein